MSATTRRVVTVAVATGRQLARRRGALLLLIALPFLFYAGSSDGGSSSHAVTVAGVASAFGISGAAIFAARAARQVDQRLVLGGYRTGEIYAGRLLLLEALSIPILAVTAVVVTMGSHPDQPTTLLLGLATVALVGVPFGVAVGTLVPGELEATLLLIGVVGVQLSVHTTTTIAKAIPLWGSHRLLEVAVGDSYPIWPALAASLGYAAVLTVVGALALTFRAGVRGHGERRGGSPRQALPGR